MRSITCRRRAGAFIPKSAGRTRRCSNWPNRFATRGPIVLTFELHQGLGRQHLIGRLRLAVRGNVLPRAAGAVDVSRACFDGSRGSCRAAHRRSSECYWRRFTSNERSTSRLAALPAPQIGILRHESIQSERRARAVANAAARACARARRDQKSGSAGGAGRVAIALPDLPGTFRIADVANEVAAAGRTGRLVGRPEERAHLAVDRQSPVAVSLRPRYWSIRRTTSGAWVRRRRIRNCSIGWPRRCATMAAR